MAFDHLPLQMPQAYVRVQQRSPRFLQVREQESFYDDTSQSVSITTTPRYRFQESLILVQHSKK